MISVENKATVRTFRDTNRQIFGLNLTAARAYWCGVTRLNSCRQPTSIGSLIGCEIHQLTPRGITDTLFHAAPIPIFHFLDVQVCAGHDLILVDQPPTELVRKVLAAIRDAVMNVLHHTFVLAVFRCGLRQHALVLAKEAPVLDLLASRKGSEVSQAHVNTNDLMCRREQVGLKLDDETGIPVTEGISLNNQPFDLALDATMQLDLDVADLAEVELAIIGETKAIPGLLVGEGLVPVALEARIARFLSLLAAAKEMLESQIDALLGLLQRLGESPRQPGIFLFPLSQHLVGIIQRERFLPILPSITANLQRLVVDPTAGIERDLHRCPLSLARVDSVLESFRRHAQMMVHDGMSVKRKGHSSPPQAVGLSGL